MIDVGVSQKNGCNRTVAGRVAARLQLRRVFDLARQIRRRVDQEPPPFVFRLTTDRDAGLRLRSNFARARSGAIRTGTVPLRQTAAGCAAENVDANQPEVFAVAMLLD